MKVKRTDTGKEFDLNVDCFVHGHASYRIGQSLTENPFRIDAGPVILGYHDSWVLGWEASERVAERNRIT